MDQSPKVIEALEKAEVEARKMDMDEIICMRKKICITWLHRGDAPNKYFFTQLKAKQA